MTITTPHTTPPAVDPPDPEALEALIEEAHRHTRRRRRRNAAWLLFFALFGVGAVLGLAATAGGGSTASPPTHASPRRPVITPLRSPSNGALTIMAVRANAKAEGPAGYYGISEIGRQGRTQVFVRCPGGAGWCGELLSVDWAPDGRHLALSVTSFGANNPYNGIHVIDTTTGADHQFTACRPTCDAYGLDWSPDGTKLAYAARDGLHLINADGSGQRMLAASHAGYGSSPSWSPDGRWLAYGSPGGAIRLIRNDGTHDALLVRHGSSPAWSPTGQVIAYLARCGIRLVTPTGTDITPAGSRGCRAIGVQGAPAWSPDGQRIAIGTFYHGIYIINTDGSNLRHLRTPPPGGRFSPGQARISWQPLP